MVQFKNVRKQGYLPDRIANEILQQVTDGALQPGDALPTETALAQAFGVSRNVVREAIARLRSDGVIDTKQGRGAVVKPSSERKTFRIDPRNVGPTRQLGGPFRVAGVTGMRRCRTGCGAAQQHGYFHFE